MSNFSIVSFEKLQGKTLVEITHDDENINFITSTGESFHMHHYQDCCEVVRIESIVGDLKDLLGHPLLIAEESSNQDAPTQNSDSYTWTFYKLATFKGYVDIRWLGESNGYYSESVSLYKGKEYTENEVINFINKNNLKKIVDKSIYQKKTNNRFNL